MIIPCSIVIPKKGLSFLPNFVGNRGRRNIAVDNIWVRCFLNETWCSIRYTMVVISWSNIPVSYVVQILYYHPWVILGLFTGLQAYMHMGFLKCQMLPSSQYVYKQFLFDSKARNPNLILIPHFISILIYKYIYWLFEEYIEKWGHYL